MSKNINPHIVFFPSPGMGHLTPFLRLASILSSRNCRITLITTDPINFPEESAQLFSFFSSHPSINRLDFNLIEEKSTSPSTDDTFIRQFKAINSSIRLLPNLLSSIHNPISAIFSDFVVTTTLAHLLATLKIPNFIVSTTSARCYTTIAYLPILLRNDFPENIQIPSLSPLPKSFIPPSWLDNSPSNRLVNDYLIPNAISLPKVNGILLNSFDFLEPETISALLNNEVLSDLPPVYPIGPLELHRNDKQHDQPWLDTKPEKSVVYVNFGTRTTLSSDEIIEIGKGLERSGYFFLWVLKETIKNENDFLESFLERTKNKGIVIQGLVNQPEILAHPSIGGFVSQCDWDSVTESVQTGVPMLMWPRHGDHKMNAEVVENAGLGIWVKEWGWGGERIVRGEEIEVRLRELMEDENLKEKGEMVKCEAKRACEVGGSSEIALMRIIHFLKHKDIE